MNKTARQTSRWTLNRRAISVAISGRADGCSRFAEIKLTRAMTALGTPPVTSRAIWLKSTASLCFIAGPGLLLRHAVLWTLGHWPLAEKVVGSGALAAFGAFLFFRTWCDQGNRRGPIAVWLGRCIRVGARQWLGRGLHSE